MPLSRGHTEARAFRNKNLPLMRHHRQVGNINGPDVLFHAFDPEAHVLLLS